MKMSRLTMINFMAISCVIGIVSKKIINPFANLITGFLHIPGGVSTGFSIMFLVITAEIIKLQNDTNDDKLVKYCGFLMGTVQGFVTVALGRIGSMGIFMPLGFMATGLAIDLTYEILKYAKGSKREERMMIANGVSAIMASIVANLIVFRLWGWVLMLYLCVSLLSGCCYGILGASVVNRLAPAMNQYQCNVDIYSHEK